MSNLKTSPTLIKSKRLTLRAMLESDANRVYQYRNQSEITEFQTWTPKNAKEVADYAKGMATRKAGESGHWYQVVLEDSSIKNSSNIIGDVAFCIDRETEKQAELGIAIDKNYHGQGYGTEAIQALIEYLFTHFQLHRIHVLIDPRNTASRTLFKKVGFRQEGHLVKSFLFNGRWDDEIIMAILREEWRNN